MGDNYIRKNVNVSIITNLERSIIDDLKPCNQNCIKVYKKCIYIDLSKEDKKYCDLQTFINILNETGNEKMNSLFEFDTLKADTFRSKQTMDEFIKGNKFEFA